jgi:hypothetical protein
MANGERFDLKTGHEENNGGLEGIYYKSEAG